MPAGPQTYPKYKPSGIDWLGDIPAGWESLNNRSVVKRRRAEFNQSDDTPVLTLTTYSLLKARLASEK